MKTKKILAAIAALTIVCGAVPTQPFADVIGNMAITASAEANIVKEGSCGANATYTLDSDGLLTISGTGAIGESAFNIYANSLAKDIKKVVINNGITELGSNSFHEAGLAEIELPNSITIIGEKAFYGCSNLTSISIPNSVENIGSTAFYNCTSLSSLTFEDNSKLESIGDAAFNSCSSLKSVVIPDSVTSIGSWTFDTSYLKSITAPCILNGNSTIDNAISNGVTVTWNHVFEEGSDMCINGDADIEGNFYGSCGAYHEETDLYDEVSYKFEPETGILTISGTGAIRENAFNIYENSLAKDIKKVVINNGIAKIGNSAFYGCTNLKSITASCKLNGNLAIADAMDNGVTVTWNHVFEEGSDMCINGDADIEGNFYGSCGAYHEETDLYDEVSYKFEPETGILTISGTGAIRFDSFANWNISFADEIIKVEIGNGITEIDDCVFYGCTSLETVEMNSVEKIGWGAFYECTSLESITIPDSVTFMDESVFEKCTNLANITAPCRLKGNESIVDAENNGVTVTWSHTEVTDERVEPTCTETGLTDGKHCSGCGEVIVEQEVIPATGHTEVIIEGIAATCTETGLTEGKYCSVCEEVLAAEEEIPMIDHTPVSAENGFEATCETDGKETDTVCGVCGAILEDGAVIPATGHNYVDGICTDCEKHEIITGKCGDSANYSFDKATGTLTISGTGAIGENAFNADYIEWASAITEVVIGNGITGIENYAFSGCSNLPSIIIPDSVENIEGTYAFYGCTKLAEITAPCSLVRNDSLLHSKNYNNSTVTYKHVGTEVIDEAEEATCTVSGFTQGSHCSECGETIVERELIPASHQFVNGICTVCGEHERIPGNCGELSFGNYSLNARYSFDRATGILTIEGYDIIGENVSDTWEEWADEVKEIVIDERITVIGENAFSKCTSLTSATLGSNVPDGFTYIPKTAKIYIPAEAYEKYAVLEESGYKFYDAETDKALSAMEFGDYVKGIGFTLDGKIGVNLQTTEAAENFTVTCDGETIPVVASANGVSFYIAPKEMVKEYTIEVNGTIKTIIPVDVVALYTADDAKPEIAKYKRVAQALADYCKAADAYFDGDEATKVVMPEGFEPIPQEELEMANEMFGDKAPDDGNTYKTSLVLDSETALKIYVSNPDGITVDDVTADVGEKIQVNKNTVCVKISNIGPYEVFDSIFTVNDGTFSVLGYLIKAYTQTEDEELLNLCYMFNMYISWSHDA